MEKGEKVVVASRVEAGTVWGHEAEAEVGAHRSPGQVEVVRMVEVLVAEGVGVDKTKAEGILLASVLKSLDPDILMKVLQCQAMRLILCMVQPHLDLGTNPCHGWYRVLTL